MTTARTFDVFVTNPNTGHVKRLKGFARFEDAARYVEKLIEHEPWLQYDIVQRHV